jgi:hypothetical protein
VTGDQNDILARLKTLLPNGWFRDSTPILDGVLSGIAWALAFVYSFANYAKLQTRIATATDGFLDLISFDFFGSTLPRRLQELDAAFRARIQAEMLLERATRTGMIRALQILTGRTPLIFEAANPFDAGGYNTGALAYGAAGGYGSLQLPFQAFLTAFRPSGQGVANVAGYGNPEGAYNTGSQIEYVTPAMVQSTVTDQDIYDAINRTKVEGTIIWTRISS